MTFGFKFPPYQRTIPWRCDADYEMAVVSPVGSGPKGDKGEPLEYDDLTEEDKLDLVNHLIVSGIEKGDTGETGASAYEIAVEHGFTGSEADWIESLDHFPSLSQEDEETWKAWLLDNIPEGAIEDAVAAAIREQAEGIAEDIYDLIYPVGSIYMSINNTNPSILFGGIWEAIPGRFLVGAGNNNASGNEALNLTVGSTGGESRHLLTAKESGVNTHFHELVPQGGGGGASSLPSTYHRHMISDAKHILATNSNSGIERVGVKAGTDITTVLSSPGGAVVRVGNDGSNSYTAYANPPVTGIDIANNNPKPAEEAHNTLPPYLAVYMWKRMPDDWTPSEEQGE